MVHSVDFIYNGFVKDITVFSDVAFSITSRVHTEMKYQILHLDVSVVRVNFKTVVLQDSEGRRSWIHQTFAEKDR